MWIIVKQLAVYKLIDDEAHFLTWGTQESGHRAQSIGNSARRKAHQPLTFSALKVLGYLLK